MLRHLTTYLPIKFQLSLGRKQNRCTIVQKRTVRKEHVFVGLAQMFVDCDSGALPLLLGKAERFGYTSHNTIPMERTLTRPSFVL